MSLIVETARVACTERSAHGVEMERQTTLPASRSDQDASTASISSKKTATTVANVRPGVNRESQNGNPTHNYFSKGRHHCDRLCEMVPEVYHSLFVHTVVMERRSVNISLQEVGIVGSDTTDRTRGCQLAAGHVAII